MSKDLIKLLKSVQEDEEVKDIPKKTITGEDVTIEYVMENVTNYKEFCDITGMKYWHQSDFLSFISPKKIFAQERLNQIESFFNKDKEIDWFNRDQKKCFVWFDIDFTTKTLRNLDSGSTETTFYDFNSIFATEDIGRFVARTFIDIFQDLL